MSRGRVSAVLGWLLVVVAAAEGGCNRQDPRSGLSTTTLTAALNANPKSSDFVIEAQNSVRLQTGSVVVAGGDVGARGTSGPFLSGGVAIDAQTGVQVETTRNLIASSVHLGTGVVVGDVQTTKLTSDAGAKHGSVTPVVPLPALPAASAVTPGTANLTVATGKIVTAAATSYALVSIGTGSTLRLPAGTYQIRDVTMSSGARLEALGTVQIHVANRIAATSGAYIGPAAGTTLTAKDVRVEVSGINGSHGGLTETPATVCFTSGVQLIGLYLVPNGTLALGTGVKGTGAFMAKDVDGGGAGAHISYQDGFPNAGGGCTPASCDDHDPCTTDACGAGGTCTHTNVAAGTSCSDGNACNGAETCNGSGACQPGTPVVCAAQDQCHGAGVCDQTTGACTNPGKSDGTACDDGNACTRADSCQAGACVGANPVTCVASDQCHGAGVCDPTTGACTSPPAPNGTPCTDGDACTQSDSCQAGSCVGANPVTCVALDQCHGVGACNPANGTCSNPPAPNDTPCDDNNACTRSDSCQAGTCTGANPVTCVAQDQCHSAGTCDTGTGRCSNPAKLEGAPCDDGNACTKGDSCQAGLCAGTPVVCTASDQCHAPGACDPTTGACSNPTVADGTGCSDGNDCTSGDACQGGSCVGGASSCPSLAITETPGGTSAVAQLGVTLAADAAAAVPGDLVTFTAEVTNTGTQLNLGFGGFNVKNTGTTPFIVGGYQQTLEYFSISESKWIPFAKLAFDKDGNPIPITDPTLVPMQWGFVQPFFGDDVTYGPSGVAGTSIAPGGDGNWIFGLPPIIPADVIKIIFDPAQSGGVRAAVSFDVPAGPPPAPGIADLGDAFPGVTGDVNDVAAQMHFPAPDTLDPTGTPMVSTDTGPLAPSASRAFTVQLPAPAMAPRNLSDPDSTYLGILAADQFNGYSTNVVATAHAPTLDPPGTNGLLHLGLQLPIITPTKSGPATSNAGLSPIYTAALANSGAAAAGPFSIVDSVEGAPIAGTTVNAPNVAAGATGHASVAAPTPSDRAAGPMTDTVAVSWNDRNGNVYGPTNSSFTLNLGPFHPEGYLSIAGGTIYPDLAGTPKTLTATALDPFGNPAAGVPIQLVITGVNPQTTTLTTGADGTASFAYAGPNLGRDTLVASATITATPVQSAPVTVDWASSVGTPCTGRTTPLDVVIVIDFSSSMQDAGKEQAAQASSDKFVDQLDLRQDRVGVVEFNDGAVLVSPLTNDATQAKAGIDAGIFINPFFGSGTNIGAGLNAAMDELTGPRARAGVATPLIVFVSDGGNSVGDPTAAYARLKSLGIRTVAIGIGSDADPATLAGSIASSKNDYFYAPSASELAWVYAEVNNDICRNPAPLVSAGGNQGFYEVRLPDLLTLQGEVHDVNGPSNDTRLTSAWTLVSGPGPVTFTDASSPVTTVLFTEPGTYVLQLEATDGFLNFADRATITVDPDPSIVGANLVVALEAAGPLTTGQTETLSATLTDGLGGPIADFLVQLTIAGANPQIMTAVTNASGAVSFSYQGARAGTDVLHATALGGTLSLDSNMVSVQWTEPATGGSVLTQGWIAAPAHASAIMGQVPVVLSPDVTLASGSLTYWPSSSPTQVHTLVANATGAPGQTIGTLDTTTLANGTYILQLDGTDDAGDEKVSQVAVTVSGDYKPGRLVVEVTDIKIPVAGMPITIGRRYDTLEKDSVGDFGNGWSLTIGHPQLDVDPGHDVTITLPDNRRVTFYFKPTNLPLFLFPHTFFQPAYTPEPGAFGTLTSDGCDMFVFMSGQLACFLDSSSVYAPTTYTYTDVYGRQFVMAATGELQSIKDIQGNTLSFAPNGIISSPAGLTVQFVRDAFGRITDVIPPSPGQFQPQFAHHYTYDADGNLAAIALDAAGTAHYTYSTDHRLLTTVDPLGNTGRTSTYDDGGRLVSDADALGNITTYGYDLTTRTTRITNPDSGVVTQVQDDRGLLVSQTDPLGHTTTHEYDSNRNETKRTNALGQVVTMTYDNNGNQTSLIDALGRSTTWTYNKYSNPTSIIDALGHTLTLAYDSRALPAVLADEIGVRLDFTNSEQGLPLIAEDAAGKRAYLGYDAAGNVTTETDFLGRTTSFGYDGIGRVISETTPRGGVTQFAYTATGQISNVTDPSNSITFSRDLDDNVTLKNDFEHFVSYLYDALNHRTDILTDNTDIHRTFDFRGNKLTERDEAGRTTSYAYDLAGQLVKTTFPDGTVKSSTYDAAERMASSTDERGNTTTFEYDPGCDCDRVSTVTDPLGRAKVITYDALGRETSVTDPAGRRTDYAYDVRNHRVETDYPDGTSMSNGYDTRGRRISTTDQTGATTAFGYDDQGHLTSVTDPLGNVTTYGYDLDGNLTQVTDANGHTTTYAYDLVHRKIQRTLPEGMFETWTYDQASRLTAHTDFRGKTTTQTWGIRDQLLSKVPDPSLGEPTVSFTYNPTRTRASMTDASGTTTYAYDDRDRLVSKTAPAGILSYTYDFSSNVASIRSSNPNGTSVDYTWDAANELVSVSDNQTGGISMTTYTATRRPLTSSLFNGVGATYGYDPLDRITSLTWQLSSGPAFASWLSTYNARGQRSTSKDVSNREASYGYDADGWLTSETVSGDPGGLTGNGAITYDLDGVGNRRSRTAAIAAIASATYSYDANDQLTSDGYDPNGSTTNADGNSYAYDFDGRVVAKNGGAVTVIYDGDGNRVAKTVGGATTSFLVDDRNPTGDVQVLEEISNGVVATRYTYGSSPLSGTRDASGAALTSYYGFDAAGSVAFLTDPAGAVTDAYDYDAWGNVVATSGSTPNRRLFVGEELDPDLGVIVLRARVYDPRRGRFWTSDPMAGDPNIPVSMNRYLYANGDPVNGRDPLGQEAALSWISFLQIDQSFMGLGGSQFLKVVKDANENAPKGSPGDIVKETIETYEKAEEYANKISKFFFGETVEFSVGMTTACELGLGAAAIDLVGDGGDKLELPMWCFEANPFKNWP